MLGREEDAEHILADRAHPGFAIDTVYGADRTEAAGAIDQRVDVRHSGCHEIDKAANLLLFGDVACGPLHRRVGGEGCAQALHVA